MSEEHNRQWPGRDATFQSHIAAVGRAHSTNLRHPRWLRKRGRKPLIHERSQGNAIAIHGVLLRTVGPRRKVFQQVREIIIG